MYFVGELLELHVNHSTVMLKHSTDSSVAYKNYAVCCKYK